MDIKGIVRKLEGSPKTRLKLYPQDYRKDIVQMIDDIMHDMWNDVGGGKLSEAELMVCGQVFWKAVITNLVNPDAIRSLEELFSRGLSSFNGKVDDIYRSQLLAESGLPEPGDRCYYVPDDIIGSSEKYMRLKASGASPKEKKIAMSGVLASLGSYFSGINAMFVALDDEKEFEKFKSLTNQILLQEGGCEIPEEFTISHKIYDGIILRNDYVLENVANEASSLARILMAVLTNTYPSRILPTRTVESLLPSVLIFFNIKEMASSVSARFTKIKKELDTIKSMNKKRVLSFKEIISLEEVVKTTLRFNIPGQNQLDAPRSEPKKFSVREKFRLDSVNMDRMKDKLLAIEKRMKEVQYSRNPNKEFEIETYQRPNRRSPQDPDLAGTYQQLGCYPDIHIYVDTSGSISQTDYEGSVAMLVDIAKKLHCDIYFNSFSNVISQEALVPCRNRSKNAIIRMINRIPKVTGGTTIDQVWSYINISEKNRRQLSVIISDYEVDVPRYMKHPMNLYYLPIKNPNKYFVESFTMKLDHNWRMLH